MNITVTPDPDGPDFGPNLNLIIQTGRIRPLVMDLTLLEGRQLWHDLGEVLELIDANADPS